MLYQTYQLQDDLIEPLRMMADQVLQLAEAIPAVASFAPRHLVAAFEMTTRFKLTHHRPSFGIRAARVGNRDAIVTEEIALALPFGNLLHFAKDVDTPQPKILVVAPLSGHFSTLLKGTVETLLADHDVYITDWANARDVPLSAGRFGVDEYIEYLISFFHEIPGAHALAVCQ
ncbi:MAG: polyhydroxyalkanoate depolymerase, partial [Hyphomicrobiaceae bacterium]